MAPFAPLGAAPLADPLASAVAGAAPVPGAAEASMMMPPPGMSPMGAAPAPGDDPLAAAIMGAPGVDPMAPSAMGGIPPELAALAAGAPGAVPAGPMYPTTDPETMAGFLSQLLQAQQLDQSALAMDQQSALTDNPIFAALMGGAPMGPGAGQDGQALGAPTGELPMPAEAAGLPF